MAELRPFRDGTSYVLVAGAASSYDVPKLRINADGDSCVTWMLDLNTRAVVTPGLVAS
jgi:hypothetical protein